MAWWKPSSWFNVDAPKPSGAENALYQEILNMLQEQQSYQNAMMPTYLHESHQKETTVDYELTAEDKTLMSNYESYANARKAWKQAEEDYKEGKITSKEYVAAKDKVNKLQKKYQKLGDQYQEIKRKQKEGVVGYEQMSDEEWYNDPMTTESERKEWDIYQSSLDRYQKALAGEIPLTQTMIDQKQKEFEQLKSTIGTITGNDPDTATATDTIGIQNLNEFKKRWQQVEETQRYGELSTAGQGALATAGLTTDLASNKIGTLMGIGNAGSSTAGGYSNLLNYQQSYTQAGYQAQAQNAATQAQMFGSLLGLGGMLGGAAIIHSSRDFKENIKKKSAKEEDKALKGLLKTNSYEYRYKKKMGLGDRKHLGTIAEESPEEITVNGKAIDLGDKIEYISMSIKSLARKMNQLHAQEA